MKLIVGISGASGAIYGIRFIEALNRLNIECHIIITRTAEKIIKYETELDIAEIVSKATQHHEIDDFTSVLASGSYMTDGMAVVPCSMKTLAGIACGYSSNLLLRAADVTLKEGRKLVLAPRETPLSPIHLENMLKLSKIGAIILPLSPAFYILPKTIDEIINQTVGKILDIFQIPNKIYQRWGKARAL